MDGVVLDDTELIELLALGDESLLVRHSCCYVIAGGGGGAQICLSLYSNQSAEWSDESDGESEKLEGVWRSNAFCVVLRSSELVEWRFCRNLSQSIMRKSNQKFALRGLRLT